MARISGGRLFHRIAVLLALVMLAGALAGCSDDTADPGTEDEAATQEQTAEPAEEPEEPIYTSWQVYINDDDEFSEGDMTYTIALNFTATNPTGDPAGDYTGTATASTGTSGQVNGVQLDAQAIAQSGNLQFTLVDTTGGDAVAPLTDNAVALSGTGTITMAASGSVSGGGGSGSFSNTSSQQIRVSVEGSVARLTVPINGHEYNFTGTFSGTEAGE